MLAKKNQLNKLPRHVAIVMDGNGRWAKARHKPRIFGHQRGKKAVRKAIDFALKKELRVLSLFAFGVDNWTRPDKEIKGLMRLFLQTLKREEKALAEQNVKLQVIGRRDNIDAKLCAAIEQVEIRTQSNTGLTLCVFFNYSGQWDILNATRQLIKSGTPSATVDIVAFEKQLATYPLSAPDLCIRTSNEKRISNFMLWQLAYSEFYFTSCLWPDFDEVIFQKALDSFCERKRRYGGVEAC